MISLGGHTEQAAGGSNHRAPININKCKLPRLKWGQNGAKHSQKKKNDVWSLAALVCYPPLRPSNHPLRAPLGPDHPVLEILESNLDKSHGVGLSQRPSVVGRGSCELDGLEIIPQEYDCIPVGRSGVPVESSLVPLQVD